MADYSNNLTDSLPAIVEAAKGLPPGADAASLLNDLEEAYGALLFNLDFEGEPSATARKNGLRPLENSITNLFRALARLSDETTDKALAHALDRSLISAANLRAEASGGLLGFPPIPFEIGSEQMLDWRGADAVRNAFANIEAALPALELIRDLAADAVVRVAGRIGESDDLDAQQQFLSDLGDIFRRHFRCDPAIPFSEGKGGAHGPFVGFAFECFKAIGLCVEHEAIRSRWRRIEAVQNKRKVAEE